MNNDRNDRKEIIRTFLRTQSDGATTREIARGTQHLMNNGSRWYGAIVEQTLRGMDDVYLDRWELQNERRGYEPVWVAVEIPEDCPHPLEGQASPD